MSEVKDGERILNLAREKQSVTYKGTPIKLSEDFSTQTLKAQKGVAWYIQSAGKKKKKSTQHSCGSEFKES